MFRGREMAHIDIGRRVLSQISGELAEYGRPEAPPKLEGKNLSLILIPSKNA